MSKLPRPITPLPAVDATSANASPSAKPTADAMTIQCPHCRKYVALSEVLAGTAIAAERTRIEAELRERAKVWVEEKTAEIQSQSQAKDELLAAAERKAKEAADAHAQTLRLQGELKTRERELELTVAKRVQEQSEQLRADASRFAREETELTLAAKEEQLRGLRMTIEDLQQKSRQGSQQTQGEAQEILLETLLSTTFPLDVLAPVAKGQFGGDVIQRVLDSSGREHGVILWESKRTRRWEQGWLVKLRGDQRAAKAGVAVIVTQAMPEGVVGFAQVDGVWVCEWRLAVQLAAAVRMTLVEVTRARAASAGRETKAELVYEYLTGPLFKNRVSAVAEHLGAMLKDLDSERTALTRIWAKREQQIRGATVAIAGMHGDLTGIAGGEEAAGGELGGVEALALGAGS